MADATFTLGLLAPAYGIEAPSALLEEELDGQLDEAGTWSFSSSLLFLAKKRRRWRTAGPKASSGVTRSPIHLGSFETTDLLHVDMFIH